MKIVRDHIVSRPCKTLPRGYAASNGSGFSHSVWSKYESCSHVGPWNSYLNGTQKIRAVDIIGEKFVQISRIEHFASIF